MLLYDGKYIVIYLHCNSYRIIRIFAFDVIIEIYRYVTYSENLV